MWQPDDVVRELTRRGELWQVAPGLLGLRGDALALLRQLDRSIADLAREETTDEWRLPPAVGFDVLARADYFRSFPQWLTVAAHLDGDPSALEQLASAPDPARMAPHAAELASVALPPALCYHVYERLADRRLDAAVTMTAAGTCWRHEGAQLAPLARGWAFTMREIVRVGDAPEVDALRRRGIERARALAVALGLQAEVAPAADPFFAPTARGKALLQRVKALKDELVVDTGSEAPLAIASFNDHERFFGEAFGIRTPTGDAASGCVAFGIERWLLAVLVAHGPDARAWPVPPEPTIGRPPLHLRAQDRLQEV